jgi:hypothetical protein
MRLTKQPASAFGAVGFCASDLNVNPRFLWLFGAVLAIILFQFDPKPRFCRALFFTAF